MNSRKHIVTGLFSLISLAGLAVSATAGPLDPPSGAIQPTYKTLSEVEARIAVNATNTPGDADSIFKITQPGSYYLTGNVTGIAGAKNIAIEISAANVTLDLNGFAVDGAGQSKTGVLMAGAYGRVLNGSIRNLSSGRGVWVTNIRATIEDVRTSETAGPGFEIDADYATMRRVSTMSALTGVDATAGDYVAISDSEFVQSYGYGVRVNDYARIENCRLNDTLFYSAPATAIKAGFGASVIGVQVVNTFGAGNLSSGVDIGASSTVDRCRIQSYAYFGTPGGGAIVSSGQAVTITNNTLCGANLGYGVLINSGSFGTRVEGNSFMGYATGVHVSNTPGCIIVRNSFWSNSTPVALYSDTSTILGPIVTATTDGAATNPLANLSF